MAIPVLKDRQDVVDVDPLDRLGTVLDGDMLSPYATLRFVRRDVVDDRSGVVFPIGYETGS